MCGVRSSPFQWPPFSSAEIEHIKSMSGQTMKAPGGKPITWIETSAQKGESKEESERAFIVSSWTRKPSAGLLADCRVRVLTGRPRSSSRSREGKGSQQTIQFQAARHSTSSWPDRNHARNPEASNTKHDSSCSQDLFPRRIPCTTYRLPLEHHRTPRKRHCRQHRLGYQVTAQIFHLHLYTDCMFSRFFVGE